MTVMTLEPVDLERARKPLVQYFDPQSTRTVAPGDMVHHYYGVPVWQMTEYLIALGAAATGDSVFEREQCCMRVAPAQRKRTGALEIGGATVEFSGTEGAIQAVLTELEWKTLRCGG